MSWWATLRIATCICHSHLLETWFETMAKMVVWTKLPTIIRYLDAAYRNECAGTESLMVSAAFKAH